MASLAVIVLLISSVGYVASELCGTSRRECAPRATCDTATSKCRCDPPYWGNGLLHCYESNQVAAQIYNDVTVTTFTNESVDFPFPCRYVVAEIWTHIPGQPPSWSICEFMISAFNKRVRGKTVLHGFDVVSSLTYLNGDHRRSVRIFGTANNGVNNISIMTAVKAVKGHDYLWDGPWDADIDPNYTDKKYNVSIKVYKDTKKGMVVYKCDACGVEITFKPYDVFLRRNQPRVPGLFISVNTAHKPSWDEGAFWYAALAPGLSVDGWLYKGIEYLDGVNKISDLERSASYVQKAMEQSLDSANARKQNQPDAQPGCTTLLKHVARKCRKSPRIKPAYVDCYWMLKEARFIRCLSDNGVDHLDFFGRCMTSHCENKDESCRNLIAEIPLVCHLSGISKLTKFINGDLCIGSHQ